MKTKLIYKDLAGNTLYTRITKKSITYFGKNRDNEILCKHGLYVLMKRKGISTKGLKEIYGGNKK